VEAIAVFGEVVNLVWFAFEPTMVEAIVPSQSFKTGVKIIRDGTAVVVVPLAQHQRQL